MDRAKILPEKFNTVFNHTGQYYAISDNAAKSYIISGAINKALRIKYENLKLETPKSYRFGVGLQIQRLNPKTYLAEIPQKRTQSLYNKLGAKNSDGSRK